MEANQIAEIAKTALLYLFQLLEVQVSDMAVYLCVAENKVGTVEKLFSLTVQGREVFVTVKRICCSIQLVGKLPLQPIFSRLQSLQR